MQIVINGRVLLKPLNGIPRFAHEAIRELDLLCKEGEAVIVFPQTEKALPSYQNIQVVMRDEPSLTWDFAVAEKLAKEKKAVYVNLASGACRYKNSVVCLYDIRPLTWGDGKKSLSTYKNKLKMWISYRSIYKNAKKIMTISEWEREEIVKYFHIKNREKICVFGAGWEHLNRISLDKELEKTLNGKEYFFSIGSVAPHKNFLWVLKVAKRNPQKQFIIAGKVDLSLWKSDILSDLPQNVQYVGYISDEQMKTYLTYAKALIFPSFYEGFGIPPLEALSLGTPAIVSDIPVLRETFLDSVHYINPNDAEVDLDGILAQKVGDSAPILQKYTWKYCAKALEEVLRTLN